MAEKINYGTYRLGTEDGEIKFGHITENQQVYSVYLHNYLSKAKHYIALSQTGEADWQKDSTLCRSEGSFSVIAGDNAKAGTLAIDLTARSGDIVLSAPRGTIRLQAKNIELNASGPDGKNGNIQLVANEKINLDAGQIVNIRSKVGMNLICKNNIEVISSNIVRLIGNDVKMHDASDAVAAALGRVRKGGSAVDVREARKAVIN